MKTSSAKAKGRKLQQWFADLLVNALGLDKDDLESRPMGSQGEDIIIGKQSRDRFPYSKKTPPYIMLVKVIML